ncbi:glycosyltransferase family 4 protein [Anaerosalibacter bizertensis]|uniref:glycosyltransferase family 4 protein n=1 Tax=Anaerosalibacter bizertensis TaxID=932217 RepID=UPI0035138B90
MLKKKVLMCSVLAEAFYESRYELIIEFIKLGYEVILIAPESDDVVRKEFNRMPVKYYKINLSRTGLDPFKDYITINQIREIIAKEEPDITYAFGGAKAAIYTTIAASKEKVNGNYCMVNGLGSIFRGEGFKNNIIKNIMTVLYKYSLSKSKGVLFQNKDDLNMFINNSIVDEGKCIIVNGSGVNLEKFSYSPVQSNNIFLFVGRLLRDKGIYEFVDAARVIKRKYPDVEFWIVGGYDTNPTSVKEDEIQSWVNDGIIKYFGRQKDVLPFYEHCSVFVLPSYHEGTPRTCLEAMAVGRPIITTDAPGCRETVIDGETGFLIPIKNSLELSDKIEFFISNNEMISIMGNKARKLAIEKYDVNKVNKMIIDFIRQ